jgi:16S rRNA (guanine(966)-N(2))-methyltransferase RsmD
MSKPVAKHGKARAGIPSNDKGAAERMRIAGLRIVGGRMRGRKLLYSGDMRTRPMKDRLREAIFNLIGPSISGKHAFDLFAGTGALGLEAISRGADWATFIEQHHPTAAIIRQNIATLEVGHQTEVITGNVFIWRKTQLANIPTTRSWVVFCSPPYDLYINMLQDVIAMIGGLIQAAPADSVFVVESDARFDFQTLPHADFWDVRAYSPAVVGIYRN